jgi:ABC-type phosphate/phosphonate transport system substrate-binding protein
MKTTNQFARRMAGFVLGAVLLTQTIHAEVLTCWFPPEWKDKADKAKAIAASLAEKSGQDIKPRIAENYPQILKAFSGTETALVYGGSFVSAILVSKGLVVPLVQGVDGKELYCGVMVFPKGGDAKKILAETPGEIAFAAGASSGESSAKAATEGKASFAVPNHGAAVNAVLAGKAKAAFVKNYWWDANQAKYGNMELFLVPGVSEQKNPDNVLSVSKSVSDETKNKIKEASIASKDVFGAKEMAPVANDKLEFSIGLMKRGQIDPLKYEWK